MNDLVKKNGNDLSVIDNYTREELELIKQQICQNSTDIELRFFLFTCKNLGLDPLKRQVYAVKRKNKVDGEYVEKMTIQIGIDGYRSIAHRTGECVGISDATFDYQLDVNGRKTSIPLSASVTVKRIIKGNICEFSSTAFFDEYNQSNYMWNSRKRGQLAKCAEALALRKAFPEQLAGTHAEDEFISQDEDTKITDKKVAEINQRIDDKDKITEAIEKIRLELTRVCEDMKTPKEKGEFLLNTFGISNFNDFKKYDLEKLHGVLSKLHTLPETAL